GTQRVFVEVGKALDKFRGESSVKVWLLAITHKVCLSIIDQNRRRLYLWHRNQDTITKQIYPSPPQGPESEKIIDEKQQQLAVALTKLPPEERLLVVMRFAIGLPSEATIEELMQITGKSRATVQRRLKHALETLKRIMNDVVHG